MGGIRSKLRDPVERRFQPFEHAVQRLRKALQFIPALWDIKPLREIIGVMS